MRLATPLQHSPFAARTWALALLAALVFLALPAASAHADADDFSYSSWDSRYDVALDADGRAIVRVTETLVAEFPEYDQNKGIVRGYPERYEGAGLDVSIVSVKDAQGRSVPFDTETDDGVLFVLTGDDTYVHGTQTYVIESTMRDAMIRGSRTGNDEFYWNLLPLNSTQKIESFHATMNFTPALAAHLTGDQRCYRGFEGERIPCTLAGPHRTDDGVSFTVQSGPREAGDGVTVAIGFDAGTVTQPAARLPDPAADYAPGLLAAGAVLAAGSTWAVLPFFRRRHQRATGVVVAQFDVPSELPPLVAGELIPGSPSPVPAEMVHLAVQGVLRLEEDAAPSRPSLRLLDAGKAHDPLDQDAVQTLFRTAETRIRIPEADEAFANRMTALATRGRKAAEERGWVMRKRSTGMVILCGIGVLFMIAALVAVVITAAKDRESLGPAIFAVIVAGVVTAITAFIAFHRHAVLTPEGALRHEYLQGVREFIRVAEADRFRMLQSYQGADRRSDGGVDVVHLYEKLLPYAMLFGEEKSWTAVLETAYTSAGHGPDWMPAASSAMLYSNLSRYSSSMSQAASYTPPSSSGGGSTGGGFSGGGGGGGFSGGR